jgi:hypothetical protein
MIKRPRRCVTARDRSLLELLLRARWLSTEQIGRQFFPGASASAVNKRTRSLVRAGLLEAVRVGRTEQNYFRLTALGYSEVGDTASRRPYRFPAQLEHFSSINDLRVWFRLRASALVSRFVAEWEFPATRAKGAVVPDAIATSCRFGDKTGYWAIEVDCSTENVSVLARKVSAYREWLSDEDALLGVLVWVPNARRLRSSVAACFRGGVVDGGLPCWITVIDDLWAMDATTKLFVSLARLAAGSEGVRWSLNEVLSYPLGPSSREEGLVGASVSNASSLGPVHPGIYVGDIDERGP